MADALSNMALAFPERGFQTPFDTAGRYKLLEKLGTMIEVPKDYVLCRAGHTPDSCYLLMEGHVVTYEYTADGQRHVYSEAVHGVADSLLMLPAVMLGYAVPVSFATLKPSKLLCIRREDLVRAIETDEAFTANLAYILAYMFIVVNERYRAESGGSVLWKLGNLLLMLSYRYGVSYDGKVLIKQRYSQQMMADYLHVNRTTVAKAMKELILAGFVERVNEHYCLRDSAGLSEYIEERRLLPN